MVLALVHSGGGTVKEVSRAVGLAGDTRRTQWCVSPVLMPLMRTLEAQVTSGAEWLAYERPKMLVK